MTKSIMSPARKLQELGLKLPKSTKLPEGLHLPFKFVKIRVNASFFLATPRMQWIAILQAILQSLEVI